MYRERDIERDCIDCRERGAAGLEPERLCCARALDKAIKHYYNKAIKPYYNKAIKP